MTFCNLLLVVLCLRASLHGTSGQFCFDQPTRTESLEGKSVTIQCQFSFPESEGVPESANLIVKAAELSFCGRENDTIYRSSTRWFSPKYRERLNVTFDLSHRITLITIHNVTKEDATNYCCRIELSFPDGNISRWQTRVGTQLTVRGRNEPSVETIPVVFAAPGENVTLLGHLTSNIATYSSNITCYGGRSAGAGCDSSRISTNCNYENNILSLQINQITSSDEGFYCWKVEISTNDGERNQYNYIGSQLLVIDKTNTLNITQPEEVEFHPSMTINCSFNVQPKNVLSTEVYWLIGDARETYVYHPNLDYIHPEYRRKTRLVDGSNLLLEDFPGPNNTIFYCRVIVRQCGDKYYSHIDTTLEEGPGTRLIEPPRMFHRYKETLVLAAYFAIKLFIAIILVAVSCAYGRAKSTKRSA